MASNQPTLLEYARFYNIAEESTRYCPVNYVDETCEPTTPTPPVEGLDPENPKERLKEVERRFCNGLIMERLAIQPEDIEFLSGCLKIKPIEGNIWRGILPEVTTSDLKGEPYLLTAEDERLVNSSDFNTTFPESPALSSPTPSVHLVVPSGPDVPVVPINTRAVFDHYNTGMVSWPTGWDSCTLSTEMPVVSSNIAPTPTSHLTGDVLPPIVEPSGTVHQFVSIESDPVLSIKEEESEADDASAPSTEYATESEFSAFVFDNTTPAPPLFEVSPSNKSQPTFYIVSPNLTKEKGFPVGWNDSQKAQVPRDLKEENGTNAFLESAVDTGIHCEQKGIMAASISRIHDDTLVVSKGTCPSSSITRPADDQNTTQLARASQNAIHKHVNLKTSYEQPANIMGTHASSSVDKRDFCVAQQEQFHMKLGYKSHSMGFRKVPFKPPHDVSSVDYKETPKPSNAVFGGLGSLSVFMQTRGSDRGDDTLSHDPSSVSLSGSAISGQGVFSNVSSLAGDSPPGPNGTGPLRKPSPEVSLQQMVTTSAFHPPPMLFLSTTLLSTHLSVIRDIEGWPDNPPKLIYREYGDALSDPRDHCDAEVILTPDTGLILTTPQELSQRYLPGHGPKDPRLNGIQGMNSPLREKIFRLMHRYALLVVLICDPDGDSTDVSSDVILAEIRERRSLAQFCDSYFEELATTLLVPIPNHSASIVLWCFGMGRLRYELLPTEVMENITEEESEYEIALRDLGINPFAARLILDNIRVGGFNQIPGFNLYPLPLPSHETVANVSTDSRAFDAFMNMSPMERDMEYGSFVGEGVMNRVSEMIESMAHSGSNETETASEDTYSTQISLE
ncbi:uncharacterized protein N7479_004989 [Penicillium vulpinum]|uniref:Uncharacterized protein n=1 Tax=Penicillium vulpinum TaxID=29845 RepID=A0A1V6R6C3_9EURO|nr:uncharacterized protein N7479_004989 [Penicillium vulpinum]KAJ5965113.1 hypothetical protein N7479_004989 [Penicillium vulpinum]OQD96736.1 hypothetical protein PENVUL_c088G04866 [Penicillium vulpinum]